jgi:superfamily II DNA or RNA helicase
MEQEWLKYEHFIVSYHAEKYDHITWHNIMIPEDELYNSNYVNDFNEHRLKRIADNREKNGKKLLYSDFGMDFLSKDKNNNYFVGQCKYFTSNNYICSHHLGSFYQIMYMRMKTQGYLYYTGKLQKEIQDDLNCCSQIISENIDFKEKDKSIIKNETELKLNSFQESVVCDILSLSKIAFQICTGVGKTLMASHVLKNTNPKYILCIAPLISSTEQLYERIPPFLSNHKSLLIDSNGITDKNKIKDFMTIDNFILFSTYKSCEDILLDMNFPKDTVILVDEVHNIINKKQLIKFINKFKYSLLLSATIPKEIHESVNIDKVYKLSINDAINNNYCVDYEIFLPHVEENKIDVDKPAELSNLTFCDKALFLATGMLLKGKRRCIVYLSNTEECETFKNTITKVFYKYHGIEIWSDIISHNVKKYKRNEILNIFEEDDYDKIKILLSVRVLDEAINMIKCDSQFITNIGDRLSEIRIIQRLGRGLRIDNNNPTKKNAMFIWCDEWNKCINVLSIFKKEDINFINKVKTINANYDKNSDKNIIDKINNSTIDINKFINIHCLTPEKKWMKNYEDWKEFHRNHSRDPKINESSLYNWVQINRKNKRNNKINNEHLNILNNDPEWKWGNMMTRERQNRSFDEFVELMKKYDDQTDKIKKQLDSWKRNILHRKNQLSKEKIDKINNIPEWKWPEKKTYKTFDEMIYLLKNTSLIEEKDLEYIKQWKKSQKVRYRKYIGDKSVDNRNGSVMTNEEIKKLEEIPGWYWNDKLTFDVNLEKFKNINDMDDKNEIKKIKEWARNQRKKYRNQIKPENEKKNNIGELSQDKIDKLNEIEDWKW